MDRWTDQSTYQQIWSSINRDARMHPKPLLSLFNVRYINYMDETDYRTEDEEEKQDKYITFLYHNPLV